MAPRDPLQESIDRLTSSFDRFATRLSALEGNGNGHDGSGPDKVAHHFRRYMPFYALVTLWALILILIPLRDDNNNNGSRLTNQAGAVTQSGAGPTSVLPSGTDSPVGTTPTSTGTSTAGPAAAGPAAAPGVVVVQGVDPLAWNQTGKTKSGFDCKPGVRQIPWSLYATPCYPKWEGGNPGATYRGVTAKEIVIVRRKFPESANSQAVEAVAAQAGAADPDVTDAARLAFVKYFNKVFELWGRTVKFVEYESQFGDSTAEAQGVGKEGACADVNVIVNELKAFAVLDGGPAFSECAAARKLVVLNAAAYYPEPFYKKHHPFLWHGVMECSRISYQVAEYYGKRLGNRPAKWAKGLQKGLPRKYGMYIPSNDAYQNCGNIMESELQKKYGVPKGSRYNYVLDISRFADEGAKAAVQFNADGVTTVILACDPISPIFLTQSAKAQNWFPEWFEIGTALNDVDNVPRLWEPDEVNGSLFGLSQLGATGKILGKDGEPPKTFKAATGTTLAAGTDGGYFAVMGLFSVLQGAGPTLTPDTIANAFFRAPPAGAPRFEVGYVSYQDGPSGIKGAHDHTGIDDSREIWWNSTAPGYDGKTGAYIETYGGKRFRNGEWPKEEPPIFK